MKKIIFALCLIHCITSSAWSDILANRVYKKIPNILEPTIDDYLLIQEYLSSPHRFYINRLDPWQYRSKASTFRFVGRDPHENIEYGIIPVNCDENFKDNCILLYASFNFEYPKCLKRLIEIIKQSDFTGHIIYHLGGWPNLDEKSLLFAHIPYAFKVCCFREAEKLGYKNALFLDASIVPLGKLMDVFKTIKEEGNYMFTTDFNMSQMCNPETFRAMDEDFSIADQIPAEVVGILGFNFENHESQLFLQRWYDVTKNHEEAYFNARPETCVVSIILHQLGMKTTRHMDHYITWDEVDHTNSSYQFFVDKKGVQPNWPN